MKPYSNDLERTLSRFGYYGRGAVLGALPRKPFIKAREKLFATLKDSELDALMARVNYYNKLTRDGHRSKPETPLDKVDRSRSRYYLDLSEYLRYFPADLNVDYLFGDITEIPHRPSLLKSRPIAGDNANSVVMNLDKFRHYTLYRDTRSWDQKKPVAVWRGHMNNPMRRALLDAHFDSPFADVGHSGSVEKHGPGAKPKVPQLAQFDYRYILSVEGVDVATNLKWAMASNSICLAPKPRFETWYAEGQLIPDHHFVLLRDDFSDLEEKIDMLESNPVLAQEIIQNANAYIRGFLDPETERRVSLLVLQKYFEATGQVSPSAFSDAFFGGA
ncbi:glycosyl transferase family 90 [Rhizobium sp. L1K21]|uniref:glycosyl transferase family 90 n=1 Tax=Rhizobium sp. L1K21 TaxID=2954933 RepID=UPI0020924BA5|nr:glycosyl transferase family 90 [Rhizobium sp. L1K21]MCO6188098.1 glycosyl transferase family 90 [Rhizobium sp. L1K21]